MGNSLPELFARHDMPSSVELNQAVVELKKLQKHKADVRTQGYYDRLQRGCSWLAKAKGAVVDPEAAFIFSWIALNALCGIRPEVLKTEWWKREERSRPAFAKQQHDDEIPRELEWFLWRVCGLDVDGRLLRGVVEDRWSDVETILRTRYLMSGVWTWRGTEDDIQKWRKSGERIAKAAIGPTVDREKMYGALREILVWRLRTLRNQLFHGCATDTHSRRRADGESELEAGSRLLGELVWVFLTLMANDLGRARYWPPIPYPRAGSAQHQPFDTSWLRTTSRQDA